MSFLFYKATFNHPLHNWDVSNVTNMGYMFCETPNFNKPLNNWDVSRVTTNIEKFVYLCKKITKQIYVYFLTTSSNHFGLIFTNKFLNGW
jgi:hypothetical protein